MVKIGICGFVLLVVFCFLNSARADGVTVCMEKARIAAQVAQALGEGYPLDKINFTYPAAHNAEEVAAAEAVVEVIKPLQRGTGLQPRGKTSARTGRPRHIWSSALYEYGQSLMHKSASSEKLGDRIKKCEAVLEDPGYIAKLSANGQGFDAMRTRATRTFQACEEQHCVGFNQERLDRIMKAINEAEQSGDVAGWVEAKRSACMTGAEI